MPRVTAEQLKQAFKNEPKKASHTLGEALREFGYTTVTDDWVEKEVGILLGGNDEYRGGPSLFLKGWLKDGME